MRALALAWLAVFYSAAVQAQSCTASVIAPAFGVYNATANATLANGAVNVSCTVIGLPLSVFYTIRLGMGGQPESPLRQLAGGPGGKARLPYNLFCDAGYNQIWADGSGQTCVVSGGRALLLGGLLTLHPVFGRINGGHFVPAGNYADIITVDVLY